MCPDPTEKRARVQQLFADSHTTPPDPNAHVALPSTPNTAWPGRPARPRLVAPGGVPLRSPFTTEGRAALVHAICHIEFNAINLALDAVWRFAGLPEDFYRDWLRVAAEEALHFSLLRDHLRDDARVTWLLPSGQWVEPAWPLGWVAVTVLMRS